MNTKQKAQVLKKSEAKQAQMATTTTSDQPAFNTANVYDFSDDPFRTKNGDLKHPNAVILKPTQEPPQVGSKWIRNTTASNSQWIYARLQLDTYVERFTEYTKAGDPYEIVKVESNATTGTRVTFKSLHGAPVILNHDGNHAKGALDIYEAWLSAFHDYMEAQPQGPTTKKFKSTATQYENVVAINQHCHINDNRISELKNNYFFHEETILALLEECDALATALAADTVRYLICQFLKEKKPFVLEYRKKQITVTRTVTGMSKLPTFGTMKYYTTPFMQIAAGCNLDRNCKEIGRHRFPCNSYIMRTYFAENSPFLVWLEKKCNQLFQLAYKTFTDLQNNCSLEDYIRRSHKPFHYDQRSNRTTLRAKCRYETGPLVIWKERVYAYQQQHVITQFQPDTQIQFQIKLCFYKLCHNQRCGIMLELGKNIIMKSAPTV